MMSPRYCCSWARAVTLSIGPGLSLRSLQRGSVVLMGTGCCGCSGGWRLIAGYWCSRPAIVYGGCLSMCPLVRTARASRSRQPRRGAAARRRSIRYSLPPPPPSPPPPTPSPPPTPPPPPTPTPTPPPPPQPPPPPPTPPPPPPPPTPPPPPPPPTPTAPPSSTPTPTPTTSAPSRWQRPRASCERGCHGPPFGAHSAGCSCERLVPRMGARPRRLSRPSPRGGTGLAVAVPAPRRRPAHRGLLHLRHGRGVGARGGRESRGAHR